MMVGEGKRLRLEARNSRPPPEPDIWAMQIAQCFDDPKEADKALTWIKANAPFALWRIEKFDGKWAFRFEDSKIDARFRKALAGDCPP